MHEFEFLHQPVNEPDNREIDKMKIIHAVAIAAAMSSAPAMAATPFTTSLSGGGGVSLSCSNSGGYNPVFTAGPLQVSCGPFTSIFSNNGGLSVFSEGFGIRLTALDGNPFDLTSVNFGFFGFGQISPITVTGRTSTSSTSTTYNLPLSGGTVATNLAAVDSVDFTVRLGNFTLNSVTGVSAIPEPATWAMMLIGFGMVGAASRYRRRTVTARFA